MYSLEEYGRMIADRVRTDAYALALKQVIEPTSIVLDIGTATGIHSLLAAKFGARKVYAVDPNEAILLARQLAVANGFEDKIEFIQDFSSNISLPEAANVIVSDLRGLLPLFDQHVPALIDARRRHLAPGGIIIPSRDILYAAVVEAHLAYNELIRPWDFPYGLNMEDAKEVVLNSWTSDFTDEITKSSFLSEPAVWAVLDYDNIEDPDITGALSFEAKRSGAAHGLLVWFDAELIPGVGFSNEPGVKKSTEVYGRGFFPLLKPVEIEKGDLIACDLSATLKGEEYVWHWCTHIKSAGERGRVKADFRQTSNQLGQLSPSHSQESAVHLVPTLSVEGQIVSHILGQMDGRSSIDSIAQEALLHFPGSFDGKDEVIRYIYELYQYYRD